MRSSALAWLVMAVVGCSPRGNRPVELAAGAPMPMRAACALAGQRCSRCHSIDRVEHARIDQPQQWKDYVHRMRLMPTSGIPPEDEPVIVRCLVFRTSGQAGLDDLARGETR